jgi:hypothetical protein
MATNKVLLNQGIKYFIFALPLFFIGPSVIYNAFQNKHTLWHYLILAIGIFACLGAVFFMSKGLKTVMKSLFNK